MIDSELTEQQYSAQTKKLILQLITNLTILKENGEVSSKLEETLENAFLKLIPENPVGSFDETFDLNYTIKTLKQKEVQESIETKRIDGALWSYFDGLADNKNPIPVINRRIEIINYMQQKGIILSDGHRKKIEKNVFVDGVFVYSPHFSVPKETIQEKPFEFEKMHNGNYEQPCNAWKATILFLDALEPEGGKLTEKIAPLLPEECPPEIVSNPSYGIGLIAYKHEPGPKFYRPTNFNVEELESKLQKMLKKS